MGYRDAPSSNSNALCTLGAQRHVEACATCVLDTRQGQKEESKMAPHSYSIHMQSPQQASPTRFCLEGVGTPDYGHHWHYRPHSETE